MSHARHIAGWAVLCCGHSASSLIGVVVDVVAAHLVFLDTLSITTNFLAHPLVSVFLELHECELRTTGASRYDTPVCCSRRTILRPPVVPAN